MQPEISNFIKLRVQLTSYLKIDALKVLPNYVIEFSILFLLRHSKKKKKKEEKKMFSFGLPT